MGFLSAESEGLEPPRPFYQPYLVSNEAPSPTWVTFLYLEEDVGLQPTRRFYTTTGGFQDRCLSN